MKFKLHLTAILSLISICTLFANNFPHYIELNVGDTVSLPDFPSITLISKSVTYVDPALKRIGASIATVQVGKDTVIVPVGYENEDVIVGNVRVGVEVINDYEIEQPNKRFHVSKDARIRIARAGESLMPKGSHIYPLFVPWNNGLRTQGWLTVCYNIDRIEGDTHGNIGRYHDGWDFGAWEGQLVRSVCRGIVVSPDDYPELIEKSLLYNKNDAPVGGNPFLVKEPDLPLLYYYTHLSGLAREFKKGEIIEKGEILGYASSRGSSGGWYHLHFSMILIDQQVHINPFPFLSEWYQETMKHYSDFLFDFEVYHFDLPVREKEQFEKDVLAGKIEPTQRFHNSLPGIVHLREAVAEAPYAGLNHAIFNQFAILKSEFNCSEEMAGELWFGHTGKARLFLNGELVYAGENKNPYHRSVQPMQTDAQMIQCKFIKGKNEVAIAIEQTNVFWQFSLRPRTRLGLPLLKL